MFNVSSTLLHLSESLHETSVRRYPSVHSSMHQVQQANRGPAVQALGQSRWVVQTNHCWSSVLWLASVSLLPWHPPPFFMCSPLVSRIPYPLFLHTTAYAAVCNSRLMTPLKSAMALLFMFNGSVWSCKNQGGYTDKMLSFQTNRCLCHSIYKLASSLHGNFFAWIHSPPSNTPKLCVCFHRDSVDLPWILVKQAFVCSVTHNVVCDSSFRTHTPVVCWTQAGYELHCLTNDTVHAGQRPELLVEGHLLFLLAIWDKT